MPEADQQAVTAFLSQAAGYAPQSGEIIGILKQMGDTMAANLAAATSDEQVDIPYHVHNHCCLSAKGVALLYFSYTPTNVRVFTGEAVGEREIVLAHTRSSVRTCHV